MINHNIMNMLFIVLLCYYFFSFSSAKLCLYVEYMKMNEKA